MGRVLVLMFVFLFFGCASSPKTLTDQLAGRWEMAKVVMDKSNDVTSEHNPESNRYFIFNPDHTFESGGDPMGKNTGKWILDSETQTIHIDSDAGEDDDSYWIVSLDGDEMHWQGTHFEFNSRFELYFSRTLAASGH